MSLDPAAAIIGAIWTRLNSDSTLGMQDKVFGDSLPDNQPSSYVTITEQANTDSYTFGARSSQSVLVNVKVTTGGAAGANAAQVAAARIDALLTDWEPTITGVSVGMLRRESRIPYPERADGATFNHVVQIFRAFAA